MERRVAVLLICHYSIHTVKKIKVGQRSEAADGINRTALREIKLLQGKVACHVAFWAAALTGE